MIRTKGKSLILLRHSSILTKFICIQYLSVNLQEMMILFIEPYLSQDLNKGNSNVNPKLKHPKCEYKTNYYISVNTNLIITLS